MSHLSHGHSHGPTTPHDHDHSHGHAHAHAHAHGSINGVDHLSDDDEELYARRATENGALLKHETRVPINGTAAKHVARDAFSRGDVGASIALHARKAAAYGSLSEKRSPGGTTRSAEAHANESTGTHLKSIVYGGLDGIITTFATVTSVAGAELSAMVIVILGVSHLFADGLSMGMGDAISEQSEIDFNTSERKREKWEMENNMEGEIAEMVELYMAKGVSQEDAEVIIHTLSKYEDAFLDHMMVEELGLMPLDPDDSPLRAGAVTMASFILFGSVPLLPYLIAFLPGVYLSATAQLYIAVVATILTLFLLGALKGHLVDYGNSWIRSGIVMAANGSFAAAVGFVMGWGLKAALGDDVALPP